MKTPEREVFRCAIYTRKSTEHNLDLEFNSLDAQREACEAYIKSQAHEGWRLVPDFYDDGGVSGASLKRPALQTLLADVRAGKINIVVVYKVDRLTRSLADFAKLVELFDQFGVSFVSITQSFNTTTSMGRLTLNVLLSFAQFEREVIGERVRDKIAASKLRTRLQPKFPANRENNREFCRIGPNYSILASIRRANSMACSQIPYAVEQGIFGGITGKFFQRTGNFRAKIGNSTSDLGPIF